VHADLCGVITPPTPGGRRYFLLLVDDYSRYMWLVLLSMKDEAATTLKRFQAEAQTEARSRCARTAAVSSPPACSPRTSPTPALGAI
jgi:histone deacetylase 1/2